MFSKGISQTFLEYNLHIFSQIFIVANKTWYLVKIDIFTYIKSEFEVSPQIIFQYTGSYSNLF